MLETFNMKDAKAAATPLDLNLKYSRKENMQSNNKIEGTEFPYRQTIGSLLYLACGTRPDLAYASTFMSQFNEVYKEEPWRGVKHILRYLQGTKFRKLNFKKTGKCLQLYSVADWGGDKTDRRSFSGYMILIVDAPVYWSSKKQSVTALSSTEPEYVAVCHVAKKVLWINNLLKETCMDLVSILQSICVNNQGAIFIAKNGVTSERSECIDIKYFFLCDLV
ncbi:unnamed protein product [Larinioides sclopetarius]|uniref:Uncharacterized protein n=1 Tax=Larinioides sclopetarius TaxID=280406 RepID=A0AAV2A7R4_9ARAC